MHGKIKFGTLEDLCEFLKEFTGKSTALFEVEEVKGMWVLTFTGGY